MTKKLKRMAIIVLFVVLIATLALTTVFFGKPSKVDALILTTSENVAVEKDKSFSTTFLGGKTGYAFSTKYNGEKVRLKDGMVGNFSAEFTPYSSVVGEVEFTEFAFAFSSDASRVSFKLVFTPFNSGVMMNVQMSNSNGKSVSVKMDGSFANTSDKSIKFSFDPYTMTVKNSEGSVVADFTSKEFLANFYAVEALPSFDVYDVEMSFSGIKDGKTAKVILFNLCGQSLSGQEFVNTSAPIVYSIPQFNNAVVGVEYTVPTAVKTFDMLDGFSDSMNGEIKLFDNQNKQIALSENKTFIPENAGYYIVEYTPIDANGLKGESKIAKFYAYSAQPDIEFNYSVPAIDMEIGVGTRLMFPKVWATSQLCEQPLKVFAKITNGDQTLIEDADCTLGLSYTFDKKGVYTVEFSAKDVSGSVQSQSITITVSDIAIFTGVDFGYNNYAKDVVINLDSAECVYNGAEAGEVLVLTTYPSGKTSTSKSLTCDEEGVYKVEFSSVVNGVNISTIRYFNVKNNNQSLWQATNGLTVQANAFAPDYADVAYNGTMLVVSRPVEAVYKNVINVADNTQEDLLCELFVAPTNPGTQELTCVDIILTDVYNPQNVIDIRLTEDIWRRKEAEKSMSVLALPMRDFTDATLAEISPGQTNPRVLKYYYTSSIYASFYGKYGDSENSNPSNSIKFYFDYKEGKLYADYASVKYHGSGKLCVVDLKDEGYVGSGNAFNGFTTGEVQLSIKMSKLKQTAHVMVLNIDGQSMTGENTVDMTAPSIMLDYAGNSEQSLPIAVVGKEYKIFDAYAVDLIDGYSKDVQVSVYKRNGSVLTEYPRLNKSFIPDTEGEYVLRYQTKDSSNNKSVKDVTITAKNKIDQLIYEFSDQLDKQYYVGYAFNYVHGLIFGGTGVVSKQVKMLCDGNEVNLDSDYSLIFEKAGNYQIQVVLTDYIGQSQPFTFDFKVDYSSLPVITDVSMPQAIIKGEAFTLPTVSAKLYTATSTTDVPAEWFVRYEGEQTEQKIVGEFIPDKAGEVELTAKAGGQSKTYNVYVIEQRALGFNYVAQYIHTNANLVQFTISDLQDPNAQSALHYEFTNDSFMTVARKIDVNFASITFGISEGRYFDTINFVMRDTLDPNIQVTLTLEKKDLKESYAYVNGVKYIVRGAFENASAFGAFKFSFNPATNEMLVNNSPVAKVLRTDANKAFNGFTSGSVYLSLAFNNVSEKVVKSKIGISNIAGQPIDPIQNGDSQGPTISVIGYMGDVQFGESFNILDVIAFDLISGVESVKVTITSPLGTVLYDSVAISEVKPIIADQIGIYRIKYVAKDSNGRQSEQILGVKIIDYVAPEIVLSGEIPTAGKVGEKVILPEMVVTDDHTPVDKIVTYVYYVAPDGEMLRATDGGFIPDQKGIYVVIYFAQDSDDATAVKYAQVRVN